ncbi:uncharacterized protein MYCGRDRAFT_96649 [Zymoseptoria tritici IPO323]|uniref:Uncharacterized protein n=1 Tax=Zymoseptoria tritici (strain CBS 115943 / IPO323) TaxID=336722 RepID=F9XN24_ZYMTI|nr:uncharacterized protein MYCGRDRAFT_96649 [Zymoseptoria tritici IPO323]EGP83589.1 hypothetical protein MYCGRDRAFT_96649 [Zymoseptoria tritici IPO323]
MPTNLTLTACSYPLWASYVDREIRDLERSSPAPSIEQLQHAKERATLKFRQKLRIDISIACAAQLRSCNDESCDWTTCLTCTEAIRRARDHGVAHSTPFKTAIAERIADAARLASNLRNPPSPTAVSAFLPPRDHLTVRAQVSNHEYGTPFPSRGPEIDKFLHDADYALHSEHDGEEMDNLLNAEHYGEEDNGEEIDDLRLLEYGEEEDDSGKEPGDDEDEVDDLRLLEYGEEEDDSSKEPGDDEYETDDLRLLEYGEEEDDGGKEPEDDEYETDDLRLLEYSEEEDDGGKEPEDDEYETDDLRMHEHDRGHKREDEDDEIDERVHAEHDTEDPVIVISDQSSDDEDDQSADFLLQDEYKAAQSVAPVHSSAEQHHGNAANDGEDEVQDQDESEDDADAAPDDSSISTESFHDYNQDRADFRFEPDSLSEYDSEDQKIIPIGVTQLRGIDIRNAINTQPPHYVRTPL